jgi:hypothetical protein
MSGETSATPVAQATPATAVGHGTGAKGPGEPAKPKSAAKQAAVTLTYYRFGSRAP